MNLEPSSSVLPELRFKALPGTKMIQMDYIYRSHKHWMLLDMSTIVRLQRSLISDANFIYQFGSALINEICITYKATL